MVGALTRASVSNHAAQGRVMKNYLEGDCGHSGWRLLGGWRCSIATCPVQPPAFVVSEIAVKDEEGYAQNFLKAAQKDIADHGGNYLAGGYKKTISLAGSEPPNRVVILQFADMDQVKEWRDQGAMDLENSVGNKYASFRIYAVEGVTK
jgi:uncharacterized protein (DUF1330 family)